MASREKSIFFKKKTKTIEILRCLGGSKFGGKPEHHHRKFEEPAAH
jgi:hypothetical protein